MTNHDRSPGRTGWAVAWVSAAALVGMLVAVAAISMRPRRYSGDSNRARCASNLHQIGLAILLYQQDHAGRYPASFGEMAAEEQIGPETFACPSTAAERSSGPTTQAVVADLDAGVAGGHCSYIYLGRGLTDQTATPTTVVAYEPLDNHDGDGSNVLFGDGHTEWETKPALAKLLATTRPAGGGHP